MDKLFDDCDFSLSGIKTLYMLVKQDVDKAFPYYPLDYIVASGDTSIISTISEYVEFKKIDIEPDANHTQELVEDSQGKSFTKTVSFNIRKLSLDAQRMFNSYFFHRNIVPLGGSPRPINIDLYNTTVIYEDVNGKWWICGYDLPLRVTSFTAGVDVSSNQWRVELVTSSYLRTRTIERSWSGYPDYIIFS